MVDGGPRKGSKYATLLDILAVCAKGAHTAPVSYQDRLALSVKASWYGGKCSTTNPARASTPNIPSLSPTRAFLARVNRT